MSLPGVNSFLAREPETTMLVSSESMPARFLASSDRVLHERSRFSDVQPLGTDSSLKFRDSCVWRIHGWRTSIMRHLSQRYSVEWVLRQRGRRGAQRGGSVPNERLNRHLDVSRHFAAYSP